MDLVVNPYEGIGPVKFGMTPAEVREVLVGTFRKYWKTADASYPTDLVQEYGMHIFYRAPGICDAIEMGSPGNPIIAHVAPLGRSFREMRALFESLDSSTKVDDSGLTCPLLGIGLFAPSAKKQPDRPVQGLIAFERGYYDG